MVDQAAARALGGEWTFTTSTASAPEMPPPGGLHYGAGWIAMHAVDLAGFDHTADFAAVVTGDLFLVEQVADVTNWFAWRVDGIAGTPDWWAMQPVVVVLVPSGGASFPADGSPVRVTATHPLTPATWATLAQLKVMLGLEPSDVDSDELLELVLASCNRWAYLQRAATGRYGGDNPAVAPNESVTLGVLGYCLIQLRDRGFAAGRAGGGFAAFDSPTMAAVRSQLGLGSMVVA